MATEPSEFQIQRALCIYLDANAHLDVLWWHSPNGGAREGREAKAFKESGVIPGIYDLAFLHRGRFFALELKRSGGGLSDAQVAMWPRYVAAGAAGVAWADNLDDAKRQIHAWGLTGR